MKQIFIKAGVILMMSLSLASCKKYLDINVDPNATLEVDPKLLFSFGVTTYINNRSGGDLFIPMALGGQSMAGGGSSTEGISWGPGSEDQYVFSPFSYSNIWSQYYTSVAANLYKAIEQSGVYLPLNPNGAAQAKVVLAQVFYELTVTYGDIPFIDAIKDTIGAPKFDDQQTVMNGCIGLLDEAIAELDPDGENKFADSYDPFYGGDIQQWIKAAKSLKLRILMTMVDADESVAAKIGELVTAGAMIESADDNMKVAYETGSGKRNPKHAISRDYNGGIEIFYGTPEVVNFMVANGDPRLPHFFDRPEGQSDYVGIAAGEDADDAVNVKIASTVHTADQPEYIFTYQEQLFYLAEIYTRGLGVAVDLTKANEYYKQAVEASCIFWGVAPAEAATYATDVLPALVSGTALTTIAYQHWVDKMDRGIDAFTQWRRSGPEGSETPKLKVPIQASGDGLFRRFEYPAAPELNVNPNAPELIPYTEKMWFDL